LNLNVIAEPVSKEKIEIFLLLHAPEQRQGP